MEKKTFWILLIVAHALFFIVQLVGPPSILQDSKEYLFAADNIIENHQLYCWDWNAKFNPDFLTKRPFLYPLILALFKLLSFGNFKIFLFLLLAVQNIISLFNLRLMLKLVQNFTGNVNYLIAFILLILTPAQLIYANLVMSEIWLQFVLLMLVNYFTYFKSETKQHIIAVLLSLIGIALKPVFIIWSFLFPIIFLYLNRKNLKLKLIILSLIPIIFVLISIQWNARRTGAYQYSSISTINLLHYNAYTVLIHENGVKKADSLIDEISLNAYKLERYEEQQKYKNQAAKRIISDNYGTYLYLHLRGVLFCIIDPGRFDITQFFNLPHTQNLVYETSKQNNKLNIIKSFLNPLGVLLIVLMLGNIIKLILGIRFIIIKRIGLYNKCFFLLFPLYILFLTGPIGSSRFAMPFIPIYLAIILITLNRNKNEITS